MENLQKQMMVILNMFKLKYTLLLVFLMGIMVFLAILDMKIRKGTEDLKVIICKDKLEILSIEYYQDAIKPLTITDAEKLKLFSILDGKITQAHICK